MELCRGQGEIVSMHGFHELLTIDRGAARIPNPFLGMGDLIQGANKEELMKGGVRVEGP
jgi:hypothetical protein